MKILLKLSSPTHLLPNIPWKALNFSKAITIPPTGPILNRIRLRRPGSSSRYKIQFLLISFTNLCDKLPFFRRGGKAAPPFFFPAILISFPNLIIEGCPISVQLNLFNPGQSKTVHLILEGFPCICVEFLISCDKRYDTGNFSIKDRCYQIG